MAHQKIDFIKSLAVSGNMVIFATRHRQYIVNMCTYTFTLDDRLIDRISPQFKGQKAMQQWLQQELELLVVQRAENTEKVLNSQDKDLARKRMMELVAGKRKPTLADLKGIMAGATHGAEDMRSDYLVEKYGL